METYYIHCYYHKKIKRNCILFESKHGEDLAGNMFQLLKETAGKYAQQYTSYVVYGRNQKEHIRDLMKQYHMSSVKFVSYGSFRYYRLLASAHYLFTDTSFPVRFIKKRGQVLTNTWHGTPLKMMGRDDSNGAYCMGNIQRNFLAADYLVYPNRFMKNVMVRAYMLDGVYEGTVLKAGYPRNSVFFCQEAAQKMKEQLGFSGKQVVAYMPTWRGTLQNIKKDEQTAETERFLRELDSRLTDQQVLLVKLHPFVQCAVSLAGMKHVFKMPECWESYEILNAADCLITDYSSVMFDFANTRKKIILFVYDEASYLKERGLYCPLDALPFPKVMTVDMLVREINTPKAYVDDDFLDEYCTYDTVDAADQLMRHILLGEKVCSEERILNNDRENVLIFVSGLAKNGMTTALLNLLHQINLEEKRYFITFLEKKIAAEPWRVSLLPAQAKILPMSSGLHYTFLEAVAMFFYYSLNLHMRWVRRYFDRVCKRELYRNFGSIDVSSCIQYEGYGRNMIQLFGRFQGKTAVFVHNDMVEELKHKTNQHKSTLQWAYNTYQVIAAVTSDILPSIEALSGRRDNIKIVNNVHDAQSVLARSKLPLTFDQDTASNCSVEQLESILHCSAVKIINIGRFSPEKEHAMLIDAFVRFQKEYPDSFLIIIGGYGALYEQTRAYAENSAASERIVIIKSMQNPMPVLRQCDLFVLSSTYEGLGLTLLEADTLGVPTISTNVTGPRGFMEQNGGYMVTPSTEGLYGGMKAFMDGHVAAMHVDYQAYNRRAVKQFYQLFENDIKENRI